MTVSYIAARSTDYSVGYMMQKRKKVLLYGDTLLLAGIRASLASYSGLTLCDVSSSVTNEEELLSLQPDVVIFDVGAVQPATLQDLTEKLPDLLLVGIDPSHSRGLVWSRQHLRELSTNNLVKIIE